MNGRRLFREEIDKRGSCPNCGYSRWKAGEQTKKIRKGVPTEALKPFYVIPRSRRMLKSQKMAEELH